MVIQGDPSEGELERDPSADGADLQENEDEAGEPSLADQLSPRMQAVVRDELAEFKNRTQAFTDRTERALAGMAEKIEALASKVGYTEEIRDLVADLHQIQIDPEDPAAKMRAAQRELDRIKRAAPSKVEDTPPPTRQNPEYLRTLLGPRIESETKEYYQKRGVSDEEFMSDAFSDRLAAADWPVGSLDYSNPEAIDRHMAARKAAIDKVVQQNAQARRPRTPTANPPAGGAGRKDYSRTAIADITDAEFTQNFQEIALATIAKHRR